MNQYNTQYDNISLNNIENYLEDNNEIKRLDKKLFYNKVAQFLYLGVTGVGFAACIANINNPGYVLNKEAGLLITMVPLLSIFYPLINKLVQIDISNQIEELIESKQYFYKNITSLEKVNIGLPNISAQLNMYEHNNEDIKKLKTSNNLFKNSAFLSLAVTGIGIAMLKNSVGLNIYPFENLEMFPAFALSLVGTIFTVANVVSHLISKQKIFHKNQDKEKLFHFLTPEEQNIVIQQESLDKENTLSKIANLRNVLKQKDNIENITITQKNSM